MTKGIDENQYMRGNYARQKIEVGGEEVSVLEMMGSVRLSSKHVLEHPKDAEGLFNRVKMHRCFGKEVETLGGSYYIAYRDDAERGIIARQIGQELGIDNSISSRDVEGEEDMR